MSATAVRHHRVHRESKQNPRKKAFAERLNRFWGRRGVKPVAWTLAALAWIPFLFVLLMVLGINPIFTAAVKKLGSDALRVPVTLRRASVSFSGKLRLGRFEIHNPPGYSEKQAASFEGMYAEVPVRSLFSQDIDIPVLTVVRPVFDLELGGEKKASNWSVLMKNLSDSLPKKQDGPERPDGEKRFKIGALKIIDPQVRYRSATFPEGIVLDLKDVELTRVGNARGSRSKLYFVLASVLQTVLTGGVKDKGLPDEVGGTLSGELKAASKAFGEVFEGIK